MNTDNNYIVMKMGTKYYIPRSRMIEDLQHAILTGEPPLASLEESRRNIGTITRLLQAASQGLIMKMQL